MPSIVVVAATFQTLDKKDHRPTIDTRWVAGSRRWSWVRRASSISLAVSYETGLPGFWDNLRTTIAADYGPIEQIQRLHDSLPPAMKRDISVKADAGLVHVRRIIGKMIASEAAGKVSTRVQAPAAPEQRRGAADGVIQAS